MAILEVHELTKSFEKDGASLLVLDRISLEVEEGEFVSVVGPSGCGKSTFLHILGGFLPRSKGAILLNHKAIEKPGPDRGMMFQDLALFPWRSVLGNVTWGLEIQNLGKQERLRTALRYLDLVNLQAFKDHYPHELSGGMKQRVALARVLAFDPEILLMDEPFGSLDSQTRELMQEEVTEIWRKTAKTILLVTHDIEEAIFLCDRVFIFRLGRRASKRWRTSTCPAHAPWRSRRRLSSPASATTSGTSSAKSSAAYGGRACRAEAVWFQLSYAAIHPSIHSSNRTWSHTRNFSLPWQTRVASHTAGGYGARRGVGLWFSEAKEAAPTGRGWCWGIQIAAFQPNLPGTLTKVDEGSSERTRSTGKICPHVFGREQAESGV